MFFGKWGRKKFIVSLTENNLCLCRIRDGGWQTQLGSVKVKDKKQHNIKNSKALQTLQQKLHHTPTQGCIYYGVGGWKLLLAPTLIELSKSHIKSLNTSLFFNGLECLGMILKILCICQKPLDFKKLNKLYVTEYVFQLVSFGVFLTFQLIL